MNHLTDTRLNEYLDGALPSEELTEAQVHLEGCRECRARLDELENVFTLLKALPDEQPSLALLPSTLARLPGHRGYAGWRLAFVLQGALAIALLLALLSSVLSLLPARFSDWQSRFSLPGLPVLALPSPATVFSRLQALADALKPGGLELAPELPDFFTFTPPALQPLMPVIELPPLTLPIFSGESMLVLAALAGAAGMAGQFALFLRRRELEE